ncbi:hypothetical protein QF044_000184 [Chryseobacterium sp. W4I1]|nr:hypothetical protein [Chryseobacterium sp. W4I1]
MLDTVTYESRVWYITIAWDSHRLRALPSALQNYNDTYKYH